MATFALQVQEPYRPPFDEFGKSPDAASMGMEPSRDERTSETSRRRLPSRGVVACPPRGGKDLKLCEVVAGCAGGLQTLAPPAHEAGNVLYTRCPQPGGHREFLETQDRQGRREILCRGSEYPSDWEVMFGPRGKVGGERRRMFAGHAEDENRLTVSHERRGRRPDHVAAVVVGPQLDQIAIGQQVFERRLGRI